MEDNTDFETMIADIAINIVDEFIELGLVKDCTDTNDWTEFNFQDAIREVLHRYESNFKKQDLL